MRWAPPAAGSFLDNKGSSRPRRRKDLFPYPGVFQTLCSRCVVFHRSVLSLGDSAETPIPCHCGVGVGGRATQRGCSGGRVSGSENFTSPATLGRLLCRLLCNVVGLETPSDLPSTAPGPGLRGEGLWGLCQDPRGSVRFPLSPGTAGGPPVRRRREAGGRYANTWRAGATSRSDKSSGRGAAQKPLPPGSRRCAPASRPPAACSPGSLAPGKDARDQGPEAAGGDARAATRGPSRAARVLSVPSGAVLVCAFSVGTREPVSPLRHPRRQTGGISPGCAQGQFLPGHKTERNCVRCVRG